MFSTVNFGGFVTTFMTSATSALAEISPVIVIIVGIALALAVIDAIFGIFLFREDIDIETEGEYHNR